jgi:hypothetical protein
MDKDNGSGVLFECGDSEEAERRRHGRGEEVSETARRLRGKTGTEERQRREDM